MKNQSIGQLPRARKHRLVIKELENETLVYDLDRDKAHCLNETAARVWKYCDGETSISAIAKRINEQKAFGGDERVVWLALEQLEKFDLLEASPKRPAFLAGVNRRRLMKDVGLAALALPLIMSIAAPTPAQSASVCAAAPPSQKPTGCPCGGNGNCLSNLCVAGLCA